MGNILSKKSQKTLETYLNAIDNAFSKGGGEVYWPASGTQLQSSFSDLLAFEFYKLINILRKDYSIQEIARHIPTYSTYFPLRQAGTIGLKVYKKYHPTLLTKDDILSFFTVLTNLIKAKVPVDPFCINGKYQTHSRGEIANICSSTKWATPTNEDKRKIASLAVSLESTSWSMFFDLYRSTGFEIHGPYQVSEHFGKKTILLIKRAHNLSPKEIWRQKYTYKNITLYLIYKEVDVTLDFFNRQYSRIPIKDNLVHFYVTIDNKSTQIDCLEKVETNLDSLIYKQTETINNLKPIELIKKSAEIYNYSLKPFYDLAKRSWKPNERVCEQIEKFGEKYWIKGKDQNVKRSIHFYRNLFDPRSGFHG